MRTFLALLIVLSCLMTGLIGCGSDDDPVIAYVVNVEADQTTINTGEGTIIRVSFAYDSPGSSYDDFDVILVVRLPAELSFRSGTSEIDGLFDDQSVNPQITACPDSGETYLVFNIDDSDLDDAENPGGEADARLDFTIDAQSAADTVEIQTRADGTLPVFGCGSEFSYEESVALRIL